MRGKAGSAAAVALLFVTGGCDPAAGVTSPERLTPPAASQDVPHAGPVSSYYDDDARARARLFFARIGAPLPEPSRQVIGESPSITGQSHVIGRTRDELADGEPLRFVVAETGIDLAPSGRHSYATVGVYSQLNKQAIIKHDVRVTVSSRLATSSFNFHEDTGIFDRSSFGSHVPISGIDCTAGGSISASTTHTAGVLWLNDVGAGSNDAKSCDGTTASCDETAQPIAVDYDPDAPPPSDSGGCTGDGGSGDLPPGTVCHSEYLYVEVSYDEGMTWTTIWEGTANVCE